MRRALLIGLLGLAACGTTTSSTKSQTTTPAKPTKKAGRSLQSREALELLRQAGLLIKRGPASYADALASLRRAAELDPKLWEAVYDEGWVLLEQGRAETAQAAFEKAVAMSNGHAAAVAGLAETQEKLGRYADAVKTIETHIDKIPAQDALALRVQLGGLYRRQGKQGDAIGVLRQVLQKDPRSVAALSELAQVYVSNQKPELAEFILRKALELDDKSKRAAILWNNLGLIALERRRDQEAFAHFDQASRLDPSFAIARRNRALVYLDAGDYKKASAELAKVVKAVPDDVAAYVALGVAERGSGDLKGAQQAYDRALALNPDSPDALYNAGVLAMEFQKAPDKALPLFERFLKVSGGSHPKRADAQQRKKELESKLAPPPAATPTPAAK